MPGKVPDRWLPYSRVGKRIPGTRILACKVPLEKNICNKVEEEERFGPKDLVQCIEERGERLGLVIDLTNTSRYYKPQEFTIRDEQAENHTIEHSKINTAGHEIPKNSVIRKFFKVVDDFLEKYKENDSLIAVHCTHGVNRTGYLICRYMINKMKFEPAQAIEAFNKARGHDLERENYLEDLKMGIKDISGGEDTEEQTSDQNRPWERNSRDYRNHRDNFRNDRDNFRNHRDNFRNPRDNFRNDRDDYRNHRHNFRNRSDDFRNPRDNFRDEDNLRPREPIRDQCNDRSNDDRNWRTKRHNGYGYDGYYDGGNSRYGGGYTMNQHYEHQGWNFQYGANQWNNGAYDWTADTSYHSNGYNGAGINDCYGDEESISHGSDQTGYTQ
ncbi:unnamed protein product [Owenia fusiformis]|uniref:RNA/RNP complex-1-interacting phosphatase n=1 Tax=Owenia fusiformis TaxID=6347 RepID=A0A8S4NSI2_OWEFU|nr:unnamed protein product [Owenia fusiformis]